MKIKELKWEQNGNEWSTSDGYCLFLITTLEETKKAAYNIKAKYILSNIEED